MDRLAPQADDRVASHRVGDNAIHHQCVAAGDVSRDGHSAPTAGKRCQWSVRQWSVADAASPRAFTLAELLVSMGVLVLLVLLFTQLLNSAATVITLGHKQMDSDSQAREVLDRMAIDLAQMVKRSDVDYYLKASGIASDCGACGNQFGNDQAAFYSMVAGYYPTVPAPPPGYTDKSPVSLLSYRINPNSTFSSYNRIERLGKGLAWNGFSPDWTPVVFLPQTIIGNWGTGPNSALFPSSEVSSQYEVIGPQVFRFEYYYLLKTGSFSATPWDTTAGHTNVSGMRDVSAIIADIAVIDPRSKALLDTVDPTGVKLARLNGADGQPPVLVDYDASTMTNPGQLLAAWRTAIDANSISLPAPAISGIRVYERYFYLGQ